MLKLCLDLLNSLQQMSGGGRPPPQPTTWGGVDHEVGGRALAKRCLGTELSSKKSSGHLQSNHLGMTGRALAKRYLGTEPSLKKSSGSLRSSRLRTTVLPRSTVLSRSGGWSRRKKAGVASVRSCSSGRSAPAADPPRNYHFFIRKTRQITIHNQTNNKKT